MDGHHESIPRSSNSMQRDILVKIMQKNNLKRNEKEKRRKTEKEKRDYAEVMTFPGGRESRANQKP